MSKRFDNKRILYILGGLIILLALTILVKVPKERATIQEELVKIDSARVYKIIINPRIKEGAPFEFTRQNGRWSMQQGNIVAEPEKNSVQNILSEAMNIKPKSLEAVDKSKWNEFNLTDSMAIRVRFLDEKLKTLADIMIGKFTYSQVSNPYADPNGNGIQGTSFVRLYNEKKVYGVDGFLALSFSGKFDDYRDKSFLRLNKEDVTKISFLFPADSGFILMKKDSIWHANDHSADSLAVADYMNSLRFLNGQDIKDNFKPAVNPLYELKIEGNNLLNVSVKCFKSESDNEFVLNSTLNPDIYFTSKRDGIFDRLFKSEKYFTTKAAKKSRK
jgi:Domain of unknown function (DUF4340)